MSLKPGHRRKWWKHSPQQRRLMTEEIAYLLAEGPLVISAEARRFAWELWRKSYGASSSWPTHDQYGQLFEASRWTVQRWVQELEGANMVTFHRPHNGTKPSVYELHPPSKWRYRDGWQYRGEYEGWVDPQTGEYVQWPVDLLKLPRETTDRRSPGPSGRLAVESTAAEG